MIKSKLFRRSKIKEEAQAETITGNEEIHEIQDKFSKTETKEKLNQTPIKEYNETLYSQGYAHKQLNSPAHPHKDPLRRTTWENAETIEQNIDHMNKKRFTSAQRDTYPEKDVNKKVDYILLKKKNRP